MFASPGAIAFQIPQIGAFGPFPVRWYGILMATAILVGLVGARVYEVIFNWDYYGQHPSKIPAVWEGGLAIHGGLIIGPIVGAWLAWKKQIPILRGLDVTGPAMVLGQAIGRWGNFFNEEAFGR